MEDVTGYIKIAQCLGAAFVVSIGCIGPSVAQGVVASKACETIGKYAETSSKVRLAMLLSMAIIETSCIFSLIIAMLLLFS